MATVKNLIRRLSFIDENVFKEAVLQPALFIDVARYRVTKMRERCAAEAALQAFDAERSMTLRASKRDQKVTEGYFKARVHKHPRHRQLVATLNESEAREEFSKLLLEAGRMRNTAIKIVAEAQGFEGNRSTMNLERESANRRLSKEARRLFEKRRQLRNE